MIDKDAINSIFITCTFFSLILAFFSLVVNGCGLLPFRIVYALLPCGFCLSILASVIAIKVGDAIYYDFTRN